MSGKKATCVCGSPVEYITIPGPYGLVWHRVFCNHCGMHLTAPSKEKVYERLERRKTHGNI